MKKQYSLLAATAMVAFSSVFTSCKEDVVEKKYAQLNVVMVSPDAPGVNAVIDSTSVNSFVLQYGAGTGYQRIEEGKKILNINTERGDFADTLLGKTEFVLKDKGHFSLFVIDSVKKLNFLFLSDDLSSPPTGKAYVRFVNLVPNSPIVNVVKSWDSSIVFGNMAFKDATGFTALNPGVYDLDVRRADTTNDVIASLPTMVFNSGKIYTFYTRGFDSTSGKKGITSTMFINKD